MKRPGNRLVGGVATALALVVVGAGVLSAHANEPVVDVQEDKDSGSLYEVTASLESFAPSVDGAPTWSVVTYTASSGGCFDVNAEWISGEQGSVGGCGFGADVDSLLRLLSIGEGMVDAEALVGGTGVQTPATLAEGYVASPDEEVLYGVVAGIVDCDCIVTALWTDGEVVSAQAVNGIFVLQREPVAGTSDLAQVASVEVTDDASRAN